jgi:hypothetical protein
MLKAFPKLFNNCLIKKSVMCVSLFIVKPYLSIYEYFIIPGDHDFELYMYEYVHELYTFCREFNNCFPIKM